MLSVAMAFSAASFAAPQNNNYANQNSMAQPPPNGYWQAPGGANTNAAPAYNSAPSRSATSRLETWGSAPAANAQAPAWHNDYRQPNTPGTADYYGQPYPSNNYPAQNHYQPEMNQSNWNRGAPPQQMKNAYGANPYPPQQGPYPEANSYQYHLDNGASAYNHPGYGSYGHNNTWNNNRLNDQFWGNSEPNPWAKPNRGNMNQGWNDMTEMPGG